MPRCNGKAKDKALQFYTYLCSLKIKMQFQIIKVIKVISLFCLQPLLSSMPQIAGISWVRLRSRTIVVHLQRLFCQHSKSVFYSSNKTFNWYFRRIRQLDIILPQVIRFNQSWHRGIFDQYYIFFWYFVWFKVWISNHQVGSPIGGDWLGTSRVNLLGTDRL